MANNSHKGQMALTPLEPKHCGQMRPEPRVMMGRIVDYRYVPVNGCGWLNPPDSVNCINCGEEL